MTMFTSSLSAALAVAVAIGTAAPAMAAPIFMPTASFTSTDVIQVQNWRDNRRSDRFERRGNRAYYNDWRGYRERRAGYRQHNGWWFPPAAFIAGAIIGGAINQPGYRSQPTYRLSAQHVEWCHNRWRSYRVSDNSYQPYNGPRRICTSPFG